MSETSVHVQVPQVESVTPTTQPEQEQASTAAEQVAAELEALATEAEATVKALVKVVVKGVRARLTTQLDTGELADRFMHQRMAIGQRAGSGKGARTERASAVKRVELEVLRAGGDSDDVNRLIAVYHAHRLLCLEQDMGKRAPQSYTAFRDQWARLVERQNRDTVEEIWVLLPGLEAECKALYLRTVEEELALATVAGECKELLRVYADRQAEQARQLAEQAKATATEKASEQEQTRKDALEAMQATAAAKAEADKAGEADKARLTEAFKAAEQVQQERIDASRKAQAEAEQAQRDQARKDKAAADATKAQQKAEQQSQKASERTVSKPRAKNLLPADSGSDPASLAAMLAECITEHDKPDDLLNLLLARLKASPDMSRQSHRAIDAALVILSRTDKPTVKPESNGKPEPSANGKALAVAA